jgi:hypothetical protein
MHKSATKCNETLSKWCKNKHGASKIIDTFDTYQSPSTKSNVSRRHRRHEIGRVQKLFSAPCRGGESSPEVFFIAMPASGVIRELSTPGPWVHSSSYMVVFSFMRLHVRSCELPIWSRSSLCNSTCCVCWDPMNIEYYVKLIVDLSCLCYLRSCMLSAASRYFGQVDACDSKREYLCSIVDSCL